MAKISSVQKNNRRRALVASLANKRKKMKEKIYDKSISLEERFKVVIALANLSRSSSKVRVRNRCELTGRSRGYFRKFGLSRNMLRDLAGKGMIPGLIKASW
jgi:small subunit ribosomal protein S14